MNGDRRAFFKAGLATAGVAAIGRPVVSASVAGDSGAPKRVRLAVSTYSYWHFRGPRYPIAKVIDHAASLGFEGVEILHRQMESEERSYVNAIKRAAFVKGVDLVMLSIHQNFVSPKPEERAKAVEHTKHCVELAARLGIPSIRLNSGRWGTIRSFDDLMKARGVEPPIEGYTEDQAFDWCIKSIEECLPTAEREGVVLARENHWGLTRTVEGLIRVHDAIKSPWLGINLDTGNFLENPYDQLERLAPRTTIVQAKTYHGGGEWYTLDLDYKRIASILRAAGFSGYVSLEMEGREDPTTAVAKSYRELREAFA